MAGVIERQKQEKLINDTRRILSGYENSGEILGVINKEMAALKNNFYINLQKEIEFPDHYEFNRSELQKIVDISKEDNLQIITTEKDYFRIKKSFRKNINFLKVELSIEHEKKFFKYLSGKL